MDKKFCVYETYKVPWPAHNYIGKTSIEKINNGYMGSGVLINLAIKKHGKKNFGVNIIEEFESEVDAYNAEVNYISLKNPYYNIHPGGAGSGAIATPYDVDTLVKEERRKKNKSRATVSFNFLYNKNLSSDAKIFYILLANLENAQCRLPRDVLCDLLGMSLHQVRRTINELKRMDVIDHISRGNGLTDIIKIKNNIIDAIDTDENKDENIHSLEDENLRLQGIIYQITKKAVQAFNKPKNQRKVV